MNRNITALILIVLAAGIYFTFTKDQLAAAKEVKAVNDEYASAITNAEQLIHVRDQVLQQYNSLSPDDRDRLDRMIPSTVDNIRLIIDLNSIGVQHGFSLKNIKAAAAPSPSTGGQQNGDAVVRPTTSQLGAISNPTLDTVTVTFSVTAPYQQFISFLQDIEANLRIMDVTKLTVAAGEGGMYDFSVELTTYWLRQ